MRKLSFITIFILYLFTLSLYSKEEFNIKVHITEISLPVTIEVDGGYTIFNYKYESKIISGNDNSIEVHDNPSGIKVVGSGTYGNGVFIETENGFTINGKSYYDDIIITRNGDKGIVINSLGIENYVMGVLPYEMSPDWPLEALKAQALAARTYAVYHYTLNKKAGRAFDVDNTTKYQVYHGKNKINENVEKAVLDTKNQVLTFKNKVIGAFFHSLCGGYTDSTKNLFGKDVPYLRGTACYYCKDKTEIWTTHISYENIKDSFGFSSSKNIRVKVTGTAGKGKVSKVLLFSDGQKVDIKASEFRSKLGATVIPSLSFSIKANGNGIDIVGKGKGHGVGMCQWGAYGMANKGLKYKNIVGHYYKLTRIVDYTRIGNIEADIW